MRRLEWLTRLARTDPRPQSEQFFTIIVVAPV